MKNRKTILEASLCLVLLCSLILPAVVAEASATALQGTWELEYYGDPGNLIAPYPDRDITLTISGSDFSGHAGVNSYYGEWEVIGDKLLIVEGYRTEAAGPEHLMEQEDRYLRIFFVPELTYEITNGKLTLSSEEGLLVYSEAAEASDDYNYRDECNVGDWMDIEQVAAGSTQTVGLKSDGTVVAVGYGYSRKEGEKQPYEVGGWTGIIQVAAGGLYTVGLKSDGTVVAVGDNYDGQCEVGGWANITQVAASGGHTVGLRSNGTVMAVGDNDDGQCNVGNWTDIVQVAAGGEHTVGLKADGTVVAVGSNAYGKCDVGNWTAITQVAAGSLYTVGLKSNGTVMAVGDNDDGQCDVGNWTGIIQVAAGTYHTVGLKADGTVVAVGCAREFDDFGQCDVGNWTDITQVAAGTYHTVGLKLDGTVVAAGGYVSCSLPTPCFIATAAYGTPMAEEIQVLREFRDKYPLTSPLGQALIDLYYRVSPPMAEFITEHPSLKPIVRAGLLPAVVMSAIAVNTTPAEKTAIIGLLVLVSAALAVWATRRWGRGPEHTSG